ncbi:glutamate racemase [Porticoccus sp. GXU_MW_L64]
MSTPKILVFDSGVGGLSILAELRRTLPQCQLVFACDNAAFPYGTKDEQTLSERVDRVLQVLIQRVDPDIVVVACNSASTLVLPRIRSHFKKPVVGVVPAIKPAAELSQSKCIGLLATPGTVKRPYTQQLIDDFASHCQVISVGSSELVTLAEEKLRGTAISAPPLQEILKPFLSAPKLDTVVLACTHFPLLREELSAAAGKSIHWIDSGEAIARRVCSLLPELHKNLPQQPESLALFTAPQPQELVAGLRQFGCVNSTVLEIKPS